VMRIYTPPVDERSSDANARVGVVIPVYNRKATLLETLPFVVEQTCPPAKLVIVDDGSTDGTPAAVEGWLARRRPGFAWKVIRARHETAAAARNVGFDEVRSLPLVAFLDSDDHWPRDFLARASATLSARRDAVAAVADRRFFDAFGEEVDNDDCRGLVTNPINWFFQHGAGVASCSLFRTEAIEAAGGWDTSFNAAEDSVLFCDLALRGAWVHIPGEAVRFNVGSAWARREEHNLSQRHVDSHRRWAQVFEEIFARICQANPAVARSEFHKALAMRWYWAGKQLFEQGHADDARECFRRAVTWQPTMFRAWRRLASTRASLWSKTTSPLKVDRSQRRAAG
jgi:glycosyltransferase involved in cell wall biosynthesis